MRRVLESLILLISIFLMFCGIYFLVEHLVLEQQNFVVYKILERSAYLEYSGFYCGATNIKNGVFITAAHCVNDINKRDKVIVKVYSGKEYKLKKVALVKRSDLALIFTNYENKNNEEDSKNKIKISAPSLGEEVYLVGHALGEFFTVRKAIVAKLGSDEFIIDANIWFGDSGSGIFNRKGNLIGVVSKAEIVPFVKGGIGFPMWGRGEYIPKEVVYEVENRE
jgi:S1-C subfamily serine protease